MASSPQFYSAYVPCYNNRGTVGAAVRSLAQQDPPPAEILVIDDGSDDDSADCAASAGAKIIRSPENRGRGAARAAAMHATPHELVLCCDGTNILPEGFARRALAYFDSPTVAAVCGRITQKGAATAANRWRGRHLFKDGAHPSDAINRKATLATYGAMISRSKATMVGGYDVRLRHTEDAELGARLLAAGFDVIFDPRLAAVTQVQNSLAQVLERHWRWQAGKNENFSFARYMRTFWFSLRAMVPLDLRARDPVAAAISLLVPHYHAWRAVQRRVQGAGTLQQEGRQ